MSNQLNKKSHLAISIGMAMTFCIFVNDSMAQPNWVTKHVSSHSSVSERQTPWVTKHNKTEDGSTQYIAYVSRAAIDEGWGVFGFFCYSTDKTPRVFYVYPRGTMEGHKLPHQQLSLEVIVNGNKHQFNKDTAQQGDSTAVSYTHLTLPTMDSV